MLKWLKPVLRHMFVTILHNQCCNLRIVTESPGVQYYDMWDTKTRLIHVVPHVILLDHM